MSGYLYVASKFSTNTDAAKGSPTLFLRTFRREAVDEFEAKVSNAKKAGAKEEELEFYELEPEAERAIAAKAVLRGKDGATITMFLERFHVGGQAERRGIGSRKDKRH